MRPSASPSHTIAIAAGCPALVCSLTSHCVTARRRSNLANVARCWARETMVALGDEITPSLPRGAANSPCYEYFGPEYNLDIKPLLMKDLNTPAYLQVRRPTEPD